MTEKKSNKPRKFSRSKKRPSNKYSKNKRRALKPSARREEFLDGIGVPKETPFKPDQFQLDAIESLCSEYDTLVAAPTGAGKTYIALEAIKHFVAEGKKAIYTAPLKALSNTKYLDFVNKFEGICDVGLLTGDRKINPDAPIVVATTEIYRNDLFAGKGDYSLVILDEFHFLSDPQRGPVWEESIILAPQSSTLLMLSASISNAEFIAEWIEVIRTKGVNIIRKHERPVELRHGFFMGENVNPLSKKNGKPSDALDRYISSFRRPRLPGGRKRRR